MTSNENQQPEPSKAWRGRRLVRLILFSAGGAALGFAYAWFIGCSGGCPLTSNPLVASLYGGVVGLLMSWG